VNEEKTDLKNNTGKK